MLTGDQYYTLEATALLIVRLSILIGVQYFTVEGNALLIVRLAMLNSVEHYTLKATALLQFLLAILTGRQSVKTPTPTSCAFSAVIQMPLPVHLQPRNRILKCCMFLVSC